MHRDVGWDRWAGRQLGQSARKGPTMGRVVEVLDTTGSKEVLLCLVRNFTGHFLRPWPLLTLMLVVNPSAQRTELTASREAQLLHTTNQYVHIVCLMRFCVREVALLHGRHPPGPSRTAVFSVRQRGTA